MASNTYDAVGNMDDLSDVITNIKPSTSTTYSMFGKTKATATFHEWLEDEDPNVGNSNKKIEGFTYSTAEGTARVRLGNYTQIMSEGVEVTETQQTVDKKGVKDEMSHQLAKKLKQIAKDCNKAILTQDSRIAGDRTTARQMGGIPYWITTNVLTDGGAGDRDLTTKLLGDAQEAAYAYSNGEADTVLLSPAQKRRVNAWTNGATKYMDEGATKLASKISVYESEFGIVKFVVERDLADSVVYLIDPSLWKSAYLRPFAKHPLPKIADKLQEVVVGEWTLEAKAEYANAAITNLKLATLS